MKNYMCKEIPYDFSVTIFCKNFLNENSVGKVREKIGSYLGTFLALNHQIWL